MMSTGTVSYTHLDVYKRQVVSKANANLKSLELFNEEKVPEDATAIIINSPTVDFNDEDAQKAVSYTHLHTLH